MLGNMIRQREDILIKNVRAVRSGYSVAKDIKAIIRNIILAVLFFIFSILIFLSSGDSDSAAAQVLFGIIFLGLAALFGYLAWLAYQKTIPAFLLEVETVIPHGEIVENGYSYGPSNFEYSTKSNSKGGLVSTLLSSLFKHKFGSKKYMFKMDPAVGNEIVDVLGNFLIKD